MSQQKRVLWKKIKLQKHILDGTSHSSQSRKTVQVKDLFLDELNKNSSQKNLDNKKIPQNNKFQQNAQEYVVKKHNSSESNQSIGSPIDNLAFEEMTSFQDKISSWNNKDDQENYSREYSEVKFNKNQSKDSQAQQFLLNLKKKSVQYRADKLNQISQIEIKQLKQQKYDKMDNKLKKKAVDMFQRFRKSQIQTIECEEMIVIPITMKQKYDKYQFLQSKQKKLKNNLSSLLASVKELRFQNQKLKKQIFIEKQNYTCIIYQFAQSVDEQFQQFKSEIGYLYKQNKALMESIVNLQEAYRQSKAMVNSLQQKCIQINEQNQFLYNKINSNEQKMEQMQQLQNKIACLQKQLEQSLKRQEKSRDLELTLMQKQRLLTISKKEIQNLKNQINIKMQELNTLQIQYNKKTKELQFRLQIQKNNQIEQIKQNLKEDLQKQYIKKFHNYQTIIKELIKSFNDLQVQNIIKKFQIQKNQSILNLILKCKPLVQNQNKANFQFIQLKKYINKNTSKEFQQILSNDSAGKVSPSFRSQKSHSQQKYSNNEQNQNSQRQRSLSTFSQRNNTLKNNIATINVQSKRKQFVPDAPLIKKTVNLMPEYETNKMSQSISELNSQKYNVGFLTARQYNINRIRTQIEEESVRAGINKQKNQRKANQYSFSELNYGQQKDYPHYQKDEDFYFKNQNQFQESSTMLYLDMLEGKTQTKSQLLLTQSFKSKQKFHLNNRQENLPKNYHQLLQRIHQKTKKQSKKQPIQHQKHRHIQSSRISNISNNSLSQKNSILQNYDLPTYNSGVHQFHQKTKMLNQVYSNYQNQNKTFNKINKTTGNIITSSFVKNKQKQRSKSPILKRDSTNKAHDNFSKDNLNKYGSSNLKRQQSQQSKKNINRLLLVRQLKKKF